jgi:hypothetical protein
VIHEPTSDERYYYAALREVMGPDYVRDPNISLPSAILSEIADRAAKMKREDMARQEFGKPLSPKTVIAELRELGPQDFQVVMHFLAERVYQARLADGRKLRDVLDFKQWLEELGEEGKL